MRRYAMSKTSQRPSLHDRRPSFEAMFREEIAHLLKKSVTDGCLCGGRRLGVEAAGVAVMFCVSCGGEWVVRSPVSCEASPQEYDNGL